MTASITASFPSERSRPLRGAACSTTEATSLICMTLSPDLKYTFPISSGLDANERKRTL